MLKTKGIFERKHLKFDTDDCVINAIEKLSSAEFKDFSNNMLQDKEYIKAHTFDMYVDGDYSKHILLILGEDTDDGVLVESSGFGNARYAAFAPNIKPYINQQILRLADNIVKDGTHKSTDGSWTISFDEVQIKYNVRVTHDNGIGNLLQSDLFNSDEISNIEAIEDGFSLTFYPDFCYNLGESKELELTTSKLKDVISCLWKDVHLTHKDEEINHATIVELQDTTLTEAGKEAWADVLNADVHRVFVGMYGLQMELSGVKANRLEEFSTMLAGYCSVQDYEKWVNETDHSQEQSQQMR